MSLAKQLIRANQTDKVSTTKFWYNVACAVSTGIVIWYSIKLVLTWEMLVVYLGSVGSFAGFSKYVMNRYTKGGESNQSDYPNSGGC